MDHVHIGHVIQKPRLIKVLISTQSLTYPFLLPPLSPTIPSHPSTQYQTMLRAPLLTLTHLQSTHTLNLTIPLRLITQLDPTLYPTPDPSTEAAPWEGELGVTFGINPAGERSPGEGEKHFPAWGG